MLTVRFDDSEVRVPVGVRLLDVLDERDDELLQTSCRDANCATCLVYLEGDLGGFEAAEGAERELLASMGAPDEARLGCQLVAKREGVVVVEGS